MLLKGVHFIREFAAVAAGLCALAQLSQPASAQTTRKPETPGEIRACFLVNFALYTEWPKDAFAEPNAPFVFGILGKDPFEKDIDIIKDTPVRGHKLLVKHCSSLKEAAGCHLLYISSSEEKRLPEIFRQLGNSSVL